MKITSMKLTDKYELLNDPPPIPHKKEKTVPLSVFNRIYLRLVTLIHLAARHTNGTIIKQSKLNKMLLLKRNGRCHLTNTLTHGLNAVAG